MAYQTKDELTMKFYTPNPNDALLKSRERPFLLLQSSKTVPESQLEWKRNNYPFTVVELVLEGECRIELENESFMVRSGDIYILPRHTNHVISFPGKIKTCIKKYFVAEGRLMDDLFEAYGLLGVHHFPDAGISGFEAVFDRMTAVFHSESASRQNEAARLAHEIVQMLADSLHTEDNLSIPALKIRYWLDRHIYGRFDLQAMCREVGYSKSTLFRICHAEFGRSPYNLYLEARIHAAKKLLTDSSVVTLSEVAEKLGFYDCYHFSRVFKQYVGISPSEFRRKKSNVHL